MKKYRRVKKRYNQGFWDYFWVGFKWLMVTGVVAGITVVLIGIAYFTQYAADTPTLDLNKLGNPEPSLVMDISDNLIAEIGEEPRIETTISEVPVDFMNALIAVEDSRFFHHRGIDPIRIVRAGITSLTGGFGSEGGSTLTQQLVKLSFLDPNEMSLSRKSKEAVLSWNLEQVYTKEEILTTYINKIYMGDGVYGVETAAQHYYGKPLKELDQHHYAMLAGIPQSPSVYNPYYEPELTKERRDDVLYRMNRIGVINDEEYEYYTNMDIMDGVVPQGEGNEIFKSTDPAHQEYIDQVMRQLNDIGLDIGTRQYVVHTTLDPAKQEFLNNAIYNNGVYDWTGQSLSPTIAVTSVKDGHVVAIAGGNANQKEVGVIDGYSYPVDGRLQPGSVIKTIVDYAPALHYLDYNMNTRIVDEPTNYTTGQVVNNYDGRYLGEMTLATALQGSRNTPALKLMQEVGVERAHSFANELGLGLSEDEWFESGAIGSMNVAMVNLANAYGTLANGGVHNDLTYITKVTDVNGVTIWEPEGGNRVMEEVKAYDIVKALRQTVQDQSTGFGRWAKVDGYDIAGKTGTNNYGLEEELGDSNLAPSVAFVGVTPDVSISIYIEGETRLRGLVYPDEQTLPSKIYSKILPAMSSDKTRFPVE